MNTFSNKKNKTELFSVNTEHLTANMSVCKCIKLIIVQYVIYIYAHNLKHTIQATLTKAKNWLRYKTAQTRRFKSNILVGFYHRNILPDAHKFHTVKHEAIFYKLRSFMKTFASSGLYKTKRENSTDHSHPATLKHRKFVCINEC